MKSEDGTGGRHPSWRCGNVTPPISFKIQEDNLMLSSFLFFFPFPFPKYKNRQNTRKLHKAKKERTFRL